MYGVVLWSDKRLGNAVIWCEDHRNLAFFRQDSSPSGAECWFEPGDLVLNYKSTNLVFVLDPDTLSGQVSTSFVAFASKQA